MGTPGMAYLFIMKLIITVLLCLAGAGVRAQELYVSTEPASNMPKNSIAVRLGNKVMNMEKGSAWRYRAEPEIRVGLSKKLMVELKGYIGTVYTGDLRVEGGSLYTKYRFYSTDDIHSHFRMAAFGKISLIDNPASYLTPYTYYIDHNNGQPPVAHIGHSSHISGDYDLDGNHSGVELGIIATQLKNKVAVSATLSATQLMDNINSSRPAGQPEWGVNYSLAAGRLMLPKTYTSYKQTNLNAYVELLGTVLGQGKGHYADLAPAVQFIFNSVAKLDIGARFYIWGNVRRMSTQGYLVRMEYNFLNAIKSRKK